MTTELLIANKRSGKIWDVSNCVEEATWTTNRTGNPGKFEFTLLKCGGVAFLEGDVVRFSVDGQLQFYGWVFTKVKDRWGVINVTCYDRLRYFKANASYAFYDLTVGQMIEQISEDLQVDVGQIDNTGYALPSYIKQDEGCLDIIDGAVQQTLLNTGKIYVFYDDGNGVALREAGSMISDVVIGDKSLLTDYSYKTDIDSQTYNYIKLARPNESTGLWETFVAEDSNNIAQWGLLQLYQTVDGDMNDAQIQAQAKASLSYYNQRMRTLTVQSLGIPGLRAGQMVLMKVSDLGDISLDQYVLLEKVTHTWKNDLHTMEFETLAI